MKAYRQVRKQGVPGVRCELKKSDLGQERAKLIKCCTISLLNG